MKLLLTEEKKMGAVSVRIAHWPNGWTVYVAVHTGLRWALLTNRDMEQHGIGRRIFLSPGSAEKRMEEVKRIIAESWLEAADPVIEDWRWHGQQYARIHLDRPVQRMTQNPSAN